MPILYRHIPFEIDRFVSISVGSHILATRKSVQPNQWIHIITTGGRAVLDRLRHQIDVGIDIQAIVKELCRFTEVQVMLLQFVLFYDTACTGICIREISLQFIVTSCQ